MAHDAFGDGGALHAIFHPTTVAVVGTAGLGTLGSKVLAGLVAGGFERAIVAVDPQVTRNACGIPVYRTLADVGTAVDLAAVVASPGETLDAIDQCVAAGVKGVVVLSRVDGTLVDRREFDCAMRERLLRSRVKLIGPGCCALMNPSLGLNVSPQLPLPVAGNVAFITQSGSLATAIIDWSCSNEALSTMDCVGWLAAMRSTSRPSTPRSSDSVN